MKRFRAIHAPDNMPVILEMDEPELRTTAWSSSTWYGRLEQDVRVKVDYDRAKEMGKYFEDPEVERLEDLVEVEPL